MFNNTSPLVSIIIPCYNSAAWVSEAIESCLSQTYQPIEVVVVDDGSTDNSLEVINQYSEQVKVITGPNQKLSAARNKGFAASHGDYILFLDADDYISSDTIAVLVEALENHENSVSVCNWSRFMDGPDGRETLEIGEEYVIEGDLFYNRFTKWFMPPHSILWPRSVFVRLGGWDEKLLNYHDYDLMARAILDGVGICRIHKGQAYYRTHSEEISSSGQISREHILSRIYFVEKLESILKEKNLLEKYAVLVGKFYSNIAANAIGLHDDLGDLCYQRAIRLGGFQAIAGSTKHNIAIRLIGFRRKQQLANLLAEFGIGSKARRHLVKRQKMYKKTQQ